ncbi:class I SAM-dependent methyltransferase [Actinoplanes couchii]|uniref:Ubiquinone/menaquinone biosynthesis methyltransferase n=1 Tax=Actinoplanes couchii TaxID=403638 RepID=A0ABQ3XU21_9ACTN|nr:methyltransferase domain-containing protein [Actinoplanes couchii]MDR6317347.1 ubiquinone/menaquinone biosynthesis C-methylase UbiE [Actinoplanes couchii]GID62019.1 ubiquinone/menaquinone biosynthesis methyltransferase [Actinoplanes couchii]
MSRTAGNREIWDRNAATYDRQIAFLDRHWFRGGREWLGARAEGRVLDVGAGTGLNLPHYPRNTVVTCVDLSPEMLRMAQDRTARRCCGDAEQLPFPDAVFDTVVCALALCTIPSPPRALSEMHRVLVPGGRLLLLDHVASAWPPIRVAQRLLERVTIPSAGEHFTRRQLPLLAGRFEIVESDRARAGTVERVHAVRSR